MITEYEDEVRKYGEVEKRVVINREKMGGKFAHPWNEKDELIGYVCRKDNGVRKLVKPVDENGIPYEEWGYGVGVCDFTEGISAVEELPTLCGCGNCSSQKIYHDKKEEWLCPFCDDL